MLQLDHLNEYRAAVRNHEAARSTYSKSPTTANRKAMQASKIKLDAAETIFRKLNQGTDR